MSDQFSLSLLCLFHVALFPTLPLHSPSGWDNEKKIGILYEHMKQFKRGQDYSSVIITPKTTEVGWL